MSYYEDNKEKEKARSKAYRLKNKEKRKVLTDKHNALRKTCPIQKQKSRESSLKTLAKQKYGITLEEYKSRMSTSSECQICGVLENLCYDHCHNTLEFRGVLCKKCNRGIGFLGDNLEGLEKAIKYLKGK